MGIRVAICCQYCSAFEVMLLFLVTDEINYSSIITLIPTYQI